ncbi:hypothetical protein ACP70R_049870 [Stipagrostis hirtigluma subsp. patula]
MAIPMASRKAPSSFMVLVVIALVTLCYASGDAPAPGPNEVALLGDAKCDVMLPCNRIRCSRYCFNQGLLARGFCTVKSDLKIYCCCRAAAAQAPETFTAPTSSKQHMHLGA